MRNHRTALIVDGSALADDTEYRERVERLVESLNGPNIKTDLYTAFPTQKSGIVSGIVAEPGYSGEISVDELVAWGTAQGYVQTLVSLPTKA